MVPLEIAAIGARVAQLAVRVAEAGNPNLRGDAVTGAVLAAASARSAACLVDINVGSAGLTRSCHSGPRGPSRTLPTPPNGRAGSINHGLGPCPADSSAIRAVTAAQIAHESLVSPTERRRGRGGGGR